MRGMLCLSDCWRQALLRVRTSARSRWRTLRTWLPPFFALRSAYFGARTAAVIVAATGLLSSCPAMAQEGSTPAAQTPPSKGGCFFHSRPAPACRFFGITDFGVAFGRNRIAVPTGPDVFVIPADQTASGSRVIGDLGVMWNIGRRDAIGVSWFVTTDFIGGTGPTGRYRRWLTDTQSLDFAVGVPVAAIALQCFA